MFKPIFGHKIYVFILFSGMKYKPIEGQTNFWPMNDKFKGANLVDSNAELTMHNVTFDYESGSFGKFLPARFSRQTGYCEIVNNSAIVTEKSFSFMAVVKIVRVNSVYVFHWGDNQEIATKISISAYKLRFQLRPERDACRLSEMTMSNKELSLNQWHTVAVSFDYDTLEVLMYVDGEVMSRVVRFRNPSCVTDHELMKAKTAFINRQ